MTPLATHFAAQLINAKFSTVAADLLALLGFRTVFGLVRAQNENGIQTAWNFNSARGTTVVDDAMQSSQGLAK